MTARAVIFSLALALRRLLLHVDQRTAAERFAKQALEAADRQLGR